MQQNDWKRIQMRETRRKESIQPKEKGKALKKQRKKIQRDRRDFERHEISFWIRACSHLPRIHWSKYFLRKVRNYLKMDWRKLRLSTQALSTIPLISVNSIEIFFILFNFLFYLMLSLLINIPFHLSTWIIEWILMHYLQ